MTYEEQEKACFLRAMGQYDASLKRPDLTERDRVIGAIQAYQRQAIVFKMFIEDNKVR